MNTKYHRVCLYGGPCAGKSTLSASLYAALKERQASVELVTEFVKAWVYQKRAPQSLDQMYILAQQMHAEDVFLSNGVSTIITDSPVLLCAIYAGYNGDPELGVELGHICEFVERKYPALNLILERDPEQFQAAGRYHTAAQSLEVDGLIKAAVMKHCPAESIFVIPSKNRKERALDIVLDHINL